MTERQSNIWHIPEGWEVKKLKQCFKFKNGKFFSNELREKTDCEYRYPVYGGNGIIGYCNEHLLDKETIIIGRVGEYCGNVFKTQDKSWVTDNAMLVSDVLLKDFDINFWTVMLNSLHFNHYSDSTGQPKITQGSIGAISVIYPSRIIEQSAIAAILSKVDESIASVQASISAAERLKKSLMQNLLTGRMKPDGTLRKDDEFYVDEKFGKVPKGWVVKKVKDLFYLNQNTLSNKTDANYRFRYITIESVNTEHIDFESCPEFSFKDSPGRARRIIKDNDILISGVRPNLKAFAIYNKPDSNNWICSTGFHVLTAKENVCTQFFFYQILSSIGASQFHSWVAGSNYPAIGDSDMKKMMLYVPEYKEQIIINQKIEGISKMQIEKQNQIMILGKLKKSLMQNLLTGRVRVKM